MQTKEAAAVVAEGLIDVAWRLKHTLVNFKSCNMDLLKGLLVPTSSK